MAIVSISEAARLTGKSRKTIQRYVADGRISMSQHVAGEKGIDISELVRVFGELSQSDHALSHASVSQADAPHVAHNVAALETRIKLLEAELVTRDAVIEARDAVIAAQRENLTDMRQAMKLLEGPRKRPWWRFGR